MKRNRLVILLLHFLQRLRFRTLFLVAAALLVLDLLVPDAIPFVDEILLALATLLLARRRKPEDGAPEPQKDVA